MHDVKEWRGSGLLPTYWGKHHDLIVLHPHCDNLPISSSMPATHTIAQRVEITLRVKNKGPRWILSDYHYHGDIDSTALIDWVGPPPANSGILGKKVCVYIYICIHIRTFM